MKFPLPREVYGWLLHWALAREVSLTFPGRFLGGIFSLSLAAFLAPWSAGRLLHWGLPREMDRSISLGLAREVPGPWNPCRYSTGLGRVLHRAAFSV